MPVDHGVLPAAEVAGVAPPTSNIKIRSCYCCCGRSLINEYCTTGKKVCNTTSSNPTTSNNSTRPRPSWNCGHLCLRVFGCANVATEVVTAEVEHTFNECVVAKNTGDVGPYRRRHKKKTT